MDLQSENIKVNYVKYNKRKEKLNKQKRRRRKEFAGDATREVLRFLSQKEMGK